VTNRVDNEQTASFVLPLNDPSATLDQVGGKGASLARLAAAGLPVPPGFHVTTAAYGRFVNVNQLKDRILAIVARISPDQVDTLEAAAREIGEVFDKAGVPGAVAGAIRRAYANLGNDLPVAVRSSATAEDLPGMSFAGQQETYLNIRGEEHVLDAVKRCWSSLWTARAIDYRARHGVAADDVSIAVVVQELVVAEAAGILFTANPVTRTRDQVVINAAWGLGEAIVGGKVTPDTLIVDKASGRVLEQEIGNKDVMTVRTANGTREELVPDERRLQPVLTAAETAELTRLGVQIEKLYGTPMDIEWVLGSGKLSIVQARPITTLGEAGAPPADSVGNDLTL
jgi:rifampicin phosphotransferase